MGAREVASTEEVGIFKNTPKSKGILLRKVGYRRCWHLKWKTCFEHAHFIFQLNQIDVFFIPFFNEFLSTVPLKKIGDWKPFLKWIKIFYMEKPFKKGPQKIEVPKPSSSPSHPLLNSTRNKLRWTGPEYCHDCDFTQRGPTRFSFPAKKWGFS